MWPRTRALERSSIEAYASLAITITIVVVPMTWWLQAILLLLFAGMIIDVSFHASWIIRHHNYLKVAACFGSLCLLGIFGVPPVVAQYHKQNSDEDLRVSFEFAVRQPDTLNINYIFRNLGNMSALVSGVSLFDMTGKDKTMSDPNKYINLCDKVPLMTLQMQGFLGNFMRFSIIPGITGVLRRPKEITIEGISGAPNGPIAVEGGKTRTIFAVFDIPKIEKDDDTRIFCPVVQVRDIRDVEGTAICKGASTHTVLNADSKTNSFSNIPGTQLRTLPHSLIPPTCPSS
jgi:hypothetical protein